MKVSITDVAKRAGVSVVTVSRVINNVKTVRERNRQKVLKAMEELNYHPNPAARTLASGKTGVIGLTIGNLNDAFLEGVVKSVNARLEDYGYFLALSVVPIGIKESFLFQEDRVDGIILLCPTDEVEHVLDLKKKRIPFVLLDNQEEHDVPSVVVDNYKGGFDATNHLVQLGHRRIAHIGGPDMYLSSRERKKGFLDAMKRANLSPFAIEKCEFSIEGGYNITSKWIKNGTIPSAVFAADDFIALGVINALTNEGLNVPEDVSVVGYDDQVFASQFHPRLTTVKQPEKKIGKEGVDLLVKMINGTSRRSTTIKLEPKLIVRESTIMMDDKTEKTN